MSDIYGLTQPITDASVRYYVYPVCSVKPYSHCVRCHMFLHKLASLQHDVISNLLSLHLASDDVFELYCTYDITVYSKPSSIKRGVFAMFENYATECTLFG